VSQAEVEGERGKMGKGDDAPPPSKGRTKSIKVIVNPEVSARSLGIRSEETIEVSDVAGRSHVVMYR
jgi:hypothetical protein